MQEKFEKFSWRRAKYQSHSYCRVRNEKQSKFQNTTFLFADIQIWDDFSTLNMTFKLGFLKYGEAVSGANRIQHELQIALL